MARRCGSRSATVGEARPVALAKIVTRTLKPANIMVWVV